MGLLSAVSVYIIGATVGVKAGKLYLFSGACNVLDKGTAQSSYRRRNGKINGDGPDDASQQRNLG